MTVIQHNSKFLAVILITFLGISCDNQNDKNLVNETPEDIKQVQNNDSFNVFYENGNQKINTNNFNAAIVDFTKAINLNPKAPDPYYCRGYALSALGNDTAAIRDYNQALLLKPDYKGAYFSRAVSYEVLGQLKAAVADYDKVLELDPSFSNAWFNRGLIKIKMGNKEDGLSDIKKAAELKDPRAVQYLM